ncbi:MAG TPA: hypothetical protein VGU43_00300 [Thermoplasmata archaeon]|nr:hypothetical protein [Thermoplasmata archaeon]
MSDPRGAKSAILRLFLVAFLAVCAMPPWLSGSTAAAPAPSASQLHAVATPRDFATSANGNWTLSQSPPSGNVYPGSSIGAQYTIALRSSPVGTPPISVYVPPPQLTFGTALGPLRAYGAWANFTFGGNGSVSPTLSAVFNLSLLPELSTTFNSTNRTVFSSQLVAIMTNLPYRSVNLSVSWRWVVAGPDGTVQESPWANSSLIDPAYFASVLSYGPSALTTGQSYGVCLGGPISGRLFSLHVEVAKPYDDFVQVNDSVPSGATSACWSATIPAGIAPGPLLAHIWSYDRATLLLYVLKLNLVNSTAAPGLTLASPSWRLVVNLAALSVGGLTLVAVVALPVLRKPPRSAEPPPPVPPAAT